MGDDLSTRLAGLARERTLYWKHKKTPMIAKSISTIVNDYEEILMIRVDKVPTLDETIPRSRMEQSFRLITPEAYAEAMAKLPAETGTKFTVDLERGIAATTSRS